MTVDQDGTSRSLLGSGEFMQIPIVSIMVVLILVALLWWVIGRLVVDAFILKVARVVIVVLCVLWLLNVLTGGSLGPTITFR